MAAYAVRHLAELPLIMDDEGVEWTPLQHFFGLTAFGINVYRAVEPGAPIIGEHDESDGRHEELYLVLSGSVRFEVDGEEFVCGEGTVVAVKDWTVRRCGVAQTAGATVLAVGAPAAKRFESTWRPEHFRDLPTVDD
jgi:hypothetical protein